MWVEPIKTLGSNVSQCLIASYSTSVTVDVCVCKSVSPEIYDVRLLECLYCDAMLVSSNTVCIYCLEKSTRLVLLLFIYCTYLELLPCDRGVGRRESTNTVCYQVSYLGIFLYFLLTPFKTLITLVFHSVKFQFYRKYFVVCLIKVG